jgi:hypothetical protein
LIVSSFTDGPDPILKRDARILVSLMQKRETNSATPAYRLDSGDVLGVFIEGVLGGFELNPPVQIPPVGSDWYPSIGYPISVDEDGKISLPLIEAISIRGKTISEIRRAIVAAFQEGTEPILKNEARIFVSLMKKRASELSGNVSSDFAKQTASDFVAEITEIRQSAAADPMSPPKTPSQLEQLERDYQTQLALFKREAISRNELYQSEVKLLEAQIDDANRFVRLSECVDFMRKLLAVRISQYELAVFAMKSPARPGEDRSATDSENFKALNQARRDLAKIRRQLRFYEQSQNLPSSLPVYNGKTYEECLEIANTERDLSKLLPAVRGLADLADENEANESTDAIMRIVRRGTPLASKEIRDEFEKFRMAYYKSLSPTQSTDLICNELINGNANSLIDVFHYISYLAFALDVKTTEHKLLVQQVVDSACQRYRQEESADVKKWVLQLISRYDGEVDCTNADCTVLKQIVESAFRESLKEGSFYAVSPVLVAKLAPEAEGFVERLLVELDGVTDDNLFAGDTFSRLMRAMAALPQKTKRQILPKVFEVWKRFHSNRNSPRNSPLVVLDFFARFPADCVEYLPDLRKQLYREPREDDSFKAMKHLIEKIEAYVQENESGKDPDGENR